MTVQITLGGQPWSSFPDADSEPLARLRARVTDLFQGYDHRRLCEKPGSYDYLKHEIFCQSDDAAVEVLLKKVENELTKSDVKAYVRVDAFLSKEEIKRARFLELFIYGDSIDDSDEKLRQLNKTQSVLCEVCKFPDITRVPEPLFIGKGALKKQDVFGTSTGMLVVRQHVLDLLKQAIPDQIETGQAAFAPGIKNPSGDKLFWVRPRERIGDLLLKRYPQHCPVCKRPLESRIIAWEGTGFHDERNRVHHFGKANADFAVLDGYFGDITNAKPCWHWPMVISGSLFTFLKQNKVKGFAATTGSDPVRCLLSAAGEPALEPAAREFRNILNRTASNRENRSAHYREIAASLREVAWDCADGYVYLYLTTPEVVVIDPMTWEEDESGPYRIKSFSGPGLYKMSVTAIKRAKENQGGVAVDSASLLLIDNAFFADLQEHFDWDKATAGKALECWKYCQEVAEVIGNRFCICSTPPARFKSQFTGDGLYRIDANKIVPA